MHIRIQFEIQNPAYDGTAIPLYYENIGNLLFTLFMYPRAVETQNWGISLMYYFASTAGGGAMAIPVTITRKQRQPVSSNPPVRGPKIATIERKPAPANTEVAAKAAA